MKELTGKKWSSHRCSFRPLGAHFQWAEAIRHHEDAAIRLLHGEQCEVAVECRRMVTKLRKLME